MAELFISFGLLTVVLVSSNHPRLSRYTGVFAGILVATYITIEAPISGMSMNPARSLASAFQPGFGQVFEFMSQLDLWNVIGR